MNREAPLLQSYPVYHRTIEIKGLDILKGRQDQHYIDELTNSFHILAPDYPGFGPAVFWILNHLTMLFKNT